MTAPASTTGSLRRWGTSAWMLLGILVLASVVYGALATLSGLLVPLVIAAVIGTLASPVVDWLHRHHVPRQLGAVIVMVAIVVVLVAAVVVSVRGIIEQSDQLGDELAAGVDKVGAWLADADVEIGTGSNIVDTGGSLGIDWVGGLATYFTTIFSSALAFVVGVFLGVFFLYYILSDWHRLRDWLGRNLGVPADLGAGIIDDVTGLIRRGFGALTASSIVTAVLIAATMVVLDLPLAFTVGFVTFVTSYIPYIGAIFSGAFGFLVALGAGGTTQALVLLVVILVVQNLVQTVVGNRLTSSSLSIHPIAALMSTIVGASLAGLVGAMLSAPVLASIIAVRRRVAAHGRAERVSSPIGAGDEAATGAPA